MGPLADLCAFALTFRHNLPDFTCEQKIVSNNGRVTQALVTYVSGKEHYSNVIINGKPAPGYGAEDESRPGLLTTGEFGGDLVSLFTPPIVAEFKLRKETTLRSHSARVYEFHLPADKNTFWTIYGNNWNVKPELRGELWIEPKTEKLRRLRIEPVHLASKYNIATDDTTIDYAEVSLADAGISLLPKSSETNVCTRDNDVSHLDKTVICFQNVIKFYNCHKFTAKARILGNQ